MGKYLTDINKDSVQEAIRRYNFVIYQLRKFFPLYPYGEESVIRNFSLMVFMTVSRLQVMVCLY